MNKIKILTIVFLFGITSLGYAAKYRVNNNPSASAHFTTLLAAHNAASAGDTLYVEGSPVLYAGITFTKKLIVIGPGYYIGNNPMTQAHTQNAIFGITTFDAGSEGSVVMGVFFYDDGSANPCLTINASNVVIKRDRFYKANGSNVDNSHAIKINANNVIVTQCYIEMYNLPYYTVRIYANSINALISNNYIRGTDSYSSARGLYMASNSSAEVLNNVFMNNVEVNNANFYNNIMIQGSFLSSNCALYNNIGNGTQFPLINNNQQSVNMNDVFNLSDLSPDGKYRLKSGVNPARGTGYDGTDIGMFGGPSPYVLSGIPDLPAVYHFSAPNSGSSTSGLPASVKIKSNR